MAKPHRNLKKANKGARPANSKARRIKRGVVKTCAPGSRRFQSRPIRTRIGRLFFVAETVDEIRNDDVL